MYRVLEDFLTDWKYESQSTLSLFKNLTDDSLTKVVHPDVRTLGFLAWHIVHTMQEMMAKVGLNVDIKDQENYSGENVKELCSAYENGANPHQTRSSSQSRNDRTHENAWIACSWTLWTYT